MNITYIGNGRAPHSTENSWKYAFEQLGHNVQIIEQEDAHKSGRAFVELVACNSDLILYSRTHNDTALDARWTDFWRFVEGEGVKTASLHLDVFWGIPEREQWIRDGDPLFTTGTVFTADGRKTSAASWREAGVNHVWLPPAIDERNLLPTDARFTPVETPPIVWVGSVGYHSEWQWRRVLWDFLQSEYGDRLIAYGNGTPNGSCRNNAVLTDLYAGDTLVIGDSMFADQDGRYYSDRVPETLGRGGLLLHPWMEHRDEHTISDYIAGHHYAPIICDTRALRGSIELWGRQASADNRMTIKKRAVEHVAARHTYRHRAATILQTLGLTEPAVA